MPTIIDKRNSLSRAPVNEMKFELKPGQRVSYKYPRGSNFQPDSELSRLVVSEVMRRARDSRAFMSERFADWRDVDRALRIYTTPDASEKYTTHPSQSRRQRVDKTGQSVLPRIVMPVTYVALNTLLTYQTAAFIQDPIFRYEGVGSEDVLGAILMEENIRVQSRRFAYGLALHTQWRDGYAYGLGCVSPLWTRIMGRKTVLRQSGFVDYIRKVLVRTGFSRTISRHQLLFEGNKLENVDPYRFLPDPNVSPHEVQEMEYLGWMDRDSVMNLLDQERDRRRPLTIFNTQYLRYFNPESALMKEGRERRYSDTRRHTTNNRPADIVWMYIHLIPREWKTQDGSQALGNGRYPELWVFGVAGDQILIAAQPVGLDHGRIPAAVCAPDFDGYSVNPASRMVGISDLQRVVDYQYSSHIHNIRRNINNMWVVDPYLVNIYDVATPEAGKLIRMRRAAWGRQKIDEGLKQLEVRDFTTQHVTEAQFLSREAREAVGSGDLAEGRNVHRGPRIAASTARENRRASMGRLEKDAIVIGLQSMTPLGYMIASQTQQLMEESSYVKISGTREAQLRQMFPETNLEITLGRRKVNPLELIVDFDLLPFNGSVPGSEDIEGWLRLMDTAARNPAMFQTSATMIDWGKAVTHLARQFGVKNIDDFVIQKPLVMDDGQVDQQVQQGNLVPSQSPLIAPPAGDGI